MEMFINVNVTMSFSVIPLVFLVTPGSDRSAQTALAPWWYRQMLLVRVGLHARGGNLAAVARSSFSCSLPPSSASLLCDALTGFPCISEYLVLRTCGILAYCIFTCCAADLRCKMSGFFTLFCQRREHIHGVI